MQVDSMDLELYTGGLDTVEIFRKWELLAKKHNFGALCVFEGIVREEVLNDQAQSVQALSFDIYKPLLVKWFALWQDRASKKGARILMAHSYGNVPATQSSFMCGIISRQRGVSLELYEMFIEDFKANTPIWKYDVIENKRVFALSRSMPIEGSGILG